MSVSRLRPLVLMQICLCLPACTSQKEQYPQVVAFNPQSRTVVLSQQYAGQIRSHRHIEIRAPESGILTTVSVTEGQHVKGGDPLFTFAAGGDRPGFETRPIQINAPYDGIIDRLWFQPGSQVKDGDVLTTLSDNSLMWVYFNLPEARYLEYQANKDLEKTEVDLRLANGEKFPHPGKIAAIAADFDQKTGNIPFRADFPNPEGLLRHGQSGLVLVRKLVEHAIVIPQQAAFELLDKRYVFVVDKNNVVHQREISIRNEVDDLFVVDGVGVDDRVILQGLQRLRNGEQVECVEPSPGQVTAQVK